MKRVLGAWIVLLCVSLGLSAITPQSAADATRRFTHRNHVSPYWYGSTAHPRDAEYARDCRGCHDYSVKPQRDPRGSCAACHFDQAPDGATAEQSGRWNVWFEPASPYFATSQRDLRSTYKHEDHLVLACRECHAPTDVTEEMRLPSAGDTGLCMRCHETASSSTLEKVVSDSVGPEPIDTTELRARLTTRLNSDPGLKFDGRGPFTHGEHLRRADLETSARCGACHSSVPQSSALDLRARAFDSAACGTCHIESDTTNVRVVTHIPSDGMATSQTALTFEHRDHFRAVPSSEQARNCTVIGAEDVATNGCLACHEHSASGLLADFPLRRDRQHYAGCITCHDVERFKTKDHGRWDGCVACHDFGNGSMKSNRVTTEVLRVSPGSVRFTMPPVPHPGLSDRSSQTCAACHRAAIPAAKSTTSSQRFDHAQHVPRNPTAETCDACHRTRTEQAVVAEIPRAPTTMTFDVNACEACHPGARLDETSLAGIAPRNIAEFSHEQHMQKAMDPGKPGQLVHCTTCHALDDPKPGQLVGTIESAKNCTMCHEHDAAHARWTGNTMDAEVESCAHCHEDRMPKPAPTVGVRRQSSSLANRVSVPPDFDDARDANPGERRLAVLGLPLVTLSGSQFHPGGRACKECHIDIDVNSQRSTAVIEVSGALFTLHAGNNYANDCRSCHWALKSNSLGDQSPSLATRKHEGASLEGFPGGGESAAMRRRALEGTR